MENMIENEYGFAEGVFYGYNLQIGHLGCDYIYYYFRCECGDHRAKLNRYEWTKHLHGNPPAGTPYGFYNIILPNGKKKRYIIYV